MPLTPADRRRRFEAVAAEVVEPIRRYLARRAPEHLDDVLSESLLVLWRRVDDIPEDAIPWAIGVARLQLANAERAARRQARVARRLADQPLESPPIPGDDDRADDVAAVQRTLAAMRPADAEILRLWAWDGLEPARLGPALGITANAAAVRLHRARQRFAALAGKSGVRAGHPVSTEGATP